MHALINNQYMYHIKFLHLLRFNKMISVFQLIVLVSSFPFTLLPLLIISCTHNVGKVEKLC